MEKTLDTFKVGEKGIIVAVNGEGVIRRRLFDMGVTPGAEVVLRKKVVSIIETTFFLEPLVGFEPTTPRLQITCSGQLS